MMTALLLYAYCRGIYSSRRIAQACRERVDFMSIIALDPPDFRTISNFRKRHLKALAGLFVQVLKLCEKAGLVKLGHVALDGTKIKANASKHKAMSYERMEKRAGAQRRSGRQRLRWKPRRRRPPKPGSKRRLRQRRIGKPKAARSRVRKPFPPPASPIPKPRRTSPIPKAGS
jgi:hypothetical protein